MADLSTLRDGWDMLEDEETRLLCSLTVQESLSQWQQLQEAFEWQIQQTEALFGPERREALVELQSRIRRLNEYTAADG